MFCDFSLSGEINYVTSHVYNVSLTVILMLLCFVFRPCLQLGQTFIAFDGLITILLFICICCKYLFFYFSMLRTSSFPFILFCCVCICKANLLIAFNSILI
jgi:hypothetical protein